VDGAADSLGADEASLMLVEGDNLRGASSTRTCAGEAEAWQQRARLGEGVAGWVAQTGSAVVLSEGNDLSRFPNLVTLAQMIQSDPAADGTSRDRSAQIIQAAQRAQRLVREPLTMTKPRPPTFEAVDLNALEAPRRGEISPCARAGAARWSRSRSSTTAPESRPR
jgi:hypothetical protein